MAISGQHHSPGDQLLNQDREQQKHFEAIDEFTDSTPGNVTNRVIGEERAQGWRWSKFVSFAELDYRESENCQYLKNDCLRFHVTILTHTAPHT